MLTLLGFMIAAYAVARLISQLADEKECTFSRIVAFAGIAAVMFFAILIYIQGEEIARQSQRENEQTQRLLQSFPGNR